MSVVVIDSLCSTIGCFSQKELNFSILIQRNWALLYWKFLNVVNPHFPDATPIIEMS